MKDKRLDALLETLLDPPNMVGIHAPCAYFLPHGTGELPSLCTMESLPGFSTQGHTDYPHTDCQGDIRKCEREE